MLARPAAGLLSRALRTTPRAHALQHARQYQSRLTMESMYQGTNLAKTDPMEDGADVAPRVVLDNTPPPFKVAPNVKVLGFKYPDAKAPDNKTLYAIAPRKPPMILTGVAGTYVENLYRAAHATDSLMQVEEELAKFVLPLTTDEEITKKFFSNTTIEKEEKRAAVESFAKENKLSVIAVGLLNEVVDKDHTEFLQAIVEGYQVLMRRVRCEVTAEVTFGRIPTVNEVIKARQLLNDLRTPFQYYIHTLITVNPDIGGGVVIKMGDFELDGSLNTRCNEVQKHLVRSLQQ